MKNKPFRYILLLAFQLGFAQNSPLQLEEIMKGEEFVGYAPENVTWSFDNETIFFDWNPKKEVARSTYYWKKGMSAPQLADINEAKFYKNRFLTHDEQTYFYSDGGALFSYHVKTKKKKKIFQNAGFISNLSLGKPGILFFEQNGNVFKADTNEGSILQITNFGKKPTENSKEKDSFLTSQQEELFQYVQDQKERKDFNDAKKKQLEKTFPKTFSSPQDMWSLQTNPNGNYITFIEGKRPNNKREVMMNFITDDGYNKAQDIKSKVSAKNLFPIKLGIYSVEKDSVYYADFSKLSNYTTAPKYLSLYETKKDDKKEARPFTVGRTIFNKDGSFAILDIRTQDNKDRWIASLDMNTGALTEIDHQHDEAWIGGPGIPAHYFSTGNIGFLEDQSTVYFQSEESGYSHLYTYNLKSKARKQLTQGNWEVRNVDLSKDKKFFYLSTNTKHPGNREFYKLSTQGGTLIPILTEDGSHEVTLSPDEKKLMVRYSFKNKPWELYLAPNVEKSKLQQITNSTTPEFKKYSWRTPDVISFNAQDGKKIYARVYQPQQEVKNSAAVIFVHGAGYLQNAHNWWSNYHREYMFHNLLADQGYTVLDIDYRASDGYGRDVRTGIYRHMGGKDLSDHVDGKKYLVEHYGINPEKVGIYGGSYGGFITLMALLTEPKEFKVGAALRSVTDWAHYNHGYTGNILNFPETDPDAYKKSSPIYFANNLEGNLLMLHGMVDDNVEYKDIVRLSQRFIELGKKNWDLASYPVEAHGFKETYSWVDEYRRILDHFNQYLLNK